jgi:hypothetical protein
MSDNTFFMVNILYTMKFFFATSMSRTSTKRIQVNLHGHSEVDLELMRSMTALEKNTICFKNISGDDVLECIHFYKQDLLNFFDAKSINVLLGDSDTIRDRNAVIEEDGNHWWKIFPNYYLFGEFTMFVKCEYVLDDRRTHDTTQTISLEFNTADDPTFKDIASAVENRVKTFVTNLEARTQQKFQIIEFLDGDDKSFNLEERLVKTQRQYVYGVVIQYTARWVPTSWVDDFFGPLM